MCEHEFESLRTTDGSFCMTACRKCMKSTGEIETLAKAESLLAAAKAELAAAVKKVEDFDLVVVMNKKICSELDAAKARVAAYKKALDIAMSTNQSHETYCKVEAALEEKP